MNDPIADFLTRIRNGITARKQTVTAPASNLKLRLAAILKAEGYIDDVSEDKEGPQGTITVTLRWSAQNRNAVQGVRRISTPGQRVYVRADAVPTVRKGMGTAILSTSKGVVTDRDARKQNLGGELLCEVW